MERRVVRSLRKQLSLEVEGDGREVSGEVERFGKESTRAEEYI
jgi:hypothetical protein